MAENNAEAASTANAWKEQLETISQAFKALGGVVQQVSSQMVDLMKSAGAAVKDYVSEGAGMAEEAAENQRQLALAMRTAMNASDSEIDSLTSLAKAQEKLGVVSAATQLAGAKELATNLQRKDSLDRLLPAMNDILAQQHGVTASQEDAAAVAAALSQAMNGQAEALDQYGYTLTEAQAEILQLGNEQERAAVLAQAVQQSVGGMNQALAQTDAGNMQQLATVLETTQTAVGDMANELKAQILGQMLPSLSLLSEAFLGVLQGSGSVEAMAASFDGVFTQLVSTINTMLPGLLALGGSLITAVAQGIAQNIGTVVQGALDIVSALSAALMELLPLLMESGVTLLLGLLDGIMEALPQLAETAVLLVATLAQGIGEAMPELLPAITDTVAFLCETLIQNLPLVLEAALQLITGLAEGLLAAIPVLVQALPRVISAIIDFLMESVPLLVEAGLRLFTALVEALPDIIEAVTEAIPLIIVSVLEALTESYPLLIEAGVQLFTSLIAELPFIIETIIGAMPTLIDSILFMLVELTPLIIKAGVDLLTSLIKNLPEIITAVVAAIPPIITALVTAITGRVGDIAKAGSDLIRGLWQGINDMYSWIMDKISGFMDSIVGGIKGFFGIRSPSTLFAEIGENLGLGLGLGFEQTMEQVGRDMQNAIPTRFDVPVTMHGSYAGGYGAGGVITQNISITSPLALSEKEAAREFRNMSRKLALGVV